MIEHGCRLDEEDLYGQTPVFYVVSENKLEMLELIPNERKFSFYLVFNVLLVFPIHDLGKIRGLKFQ